MIHWLWFHAGLSSGNSSWYLFPSGIASLLERFAELIVIGGLLWHKNNCHSPGCPRIGKFPAVEGGGWHYCRRHHTTNGVHRSEGDGGT